MNKPLGISVDTNDGRVLVAFDREVQVMELSVEQAVNFAQAIVQKAISLDNKSGFSSTSAGIALPNIEH